MIKNKKIFLFLLFILMLAPIFVLAADCPPNKICNPLGTADLPTLIGQIIKAVLGIVGSIALIMFIYGGFMWLTSGGSEQKITKGIQILTWAVIGLAIIFLSYALVGFVISSLTKGASGEGGGGGEGTYTPRSGTGVCKCPSSTASDETQESCKLISAATKENCQFTPY